MGNTKDLGKRIFWMVLGNVVIALGVCLFKLSLMGTDPSMSFAIGLGVVTGLDMAVTWIILNSIFFVMVFIFGRDLIGIGTVFNWFGIGILSNLWTKLLSAFITFSDDTASFIVLLLGVVFLSLGISIYQKTKLGVAPYDALAIILSRRFHKPYFWCRVATDAVCVTGALLCHGAVGWGTVFAAFGMGPIISLFDKNVTDKLTF